jgi:3-methyladenine DNA glycosylase Mpg
MKIRIKGNSLRYRLTKSDIERFSKEGYIEDEICFGNNKLVYALQRSPVNELTADFNDQKIVLYVPATIAEEWTETDRVGFENSTNALYLLIEKDFKCLDNVAEDQSDNYPNPLSFAGNGL